MSAPNLKELDWAIQELEEQESSESRYILLAALYTCRDHMLGVSESQTQIAAYSEAAPSYQERLGQYGDSDFLQAVAGIPASEAWAVMDELMDTLLTVNSKVYNSVMAKLSRL